MHLHKGIHKRDDSRGTKGIPTGFTKGITNGFTKGFTARINKRIHKRIHQGIHNSESTRTTAVQQLDTSDNNGSTRFFYTFSWRLSLFIYSTFNIIDTLSASGQPLTLVSIPGPQDAAGDHVARGGLFHPTGTLRRIVEPQLKIRSCAA